MTPAEAVHFLVDAARNDVDLRDALVKTVEMNGAKDIYELAEQHPAAIVLLAESWSDFLTQGPPGMDLLP